MQMAGHLLHTFVGRRSSKQSRLHLAKLSVGLITMSVLLMFYGQYLLHTRCNSVECSEDAQRTRRNIADTTLKSKAERLSATGGQDKGQGDEESNKADDNDITSRRKQPWENTGANGQESIDEANDEEQAVQSNEQPLFPPSSSIPTKESAQLTEWFRKMTLTEHMIVIDPDPLLSEAKEFLFPCARDEYVISDSLLKKSDEGDNINGEGAVEFVEESLCRSLNIKKASGSFKEGKLDGEGVIEYLDGSFMKASFKEGVLHGLVRKFRCKFGLCDFFDYKDWNEPKFLWEISWYRNGYRVGAAWEFKLGGGAIFGHVDNQGTLTGDNVVYVYPDDFTVIVGRFLNGVLVSGKESRIAGIEFEGDIAIPLTLMPRGPIYTYEQSNKTHMVSSESSLHLRDPYEDQLLTVGASTIDGAGRGVFLKKDVAKGSVVGFYNGVRMSDIESKIRRADRKSPYRVDNDWAAKSQVLNIPEGFREPKQYSASFGHLINHSKTPNAWYAMIDHPRFGKIRSVVVREDLKAGDELFCDYGFLEKFVEGDKMFQTILDVGQVLSNSKDKGAFNSEMKYTVKYLKHKVDEYKPYLDMFKTVYNLINNA